MRESSLLLLLLVAVLGSCESEPEAPDDQGPPLTGDLAAWAYPDGRHVTGHVVLVVTSEEFPGLSRIEGYVDDEFVGFRDGLATLDLSIDVRPYAEGAHQVTLVVQTVGAKAEFRYRGNLVFDHATPSPGRLEGLELRDGLPLVRWQGNDDANFDSYRVRREAAGVLEGETFEIHDRASTEFLDTTLPEGLIGVQLVYSLAVHNGYEEGPRDSDVLPMGDFVDLAPYPAVEPVASPTDDRIFVIDTGSPDRLVAFSASTLQLMGQRPVPTASRALACSPDGGLLVYAHASALEILDAGSFATVHTEAFTGAVDAAFAADGRVFVAKGSQTEASIQVFDSTLEPLESISVASSPPAWVAVSSDAMRLYVINANPRTNPLGSLLLFDVSESPALLLHTRDLEAGFVQAVISPSADRIYLGHLDFVDVVDGMDLRLVRRHDTPGGLLSIATNATSLYLAYGEATGTDDPPRIERLDRQAVTRSTLWSLPGPVRNLVVTRDDSRLAVFVPDPLGQMVGFDVR